MTTDQRLRVVAATLISEELIARVVHREPRIDFIRRQDLLSPKRHAVDHRGDPRSKRSADEQAEFHRLVDSADLLCRVPDETPCAPARAVAANPGLRWVQTMPAGGGAQVRAAGLDDDQQARVVFSTTSGVHSGPIAEFSAFGVLAGAKSLPRLLEQQARREWSGRWTMGLVSEQSVTIIRRGAVGRANAVALKALGAAVICTSRSGAPVEGVDELVSTENPVDVVGRVDAIVVALPGTAATERLSSKSPLWSSPRVLISPHTAALNAAEDRLIAELFAENNYQVLDGIPLVDRADTVDFY